MARLLFTARAGGKSEGEFDSLNLAQHVGDQSDIVQVNRHELTHLLSVKQLQFMEQVHGNEIALVTQEMKTIPQADALITKERDIALVVMVADCLPVLIDGVDVIGAIHVGRRGMANGIVARTISEMKNVGGRDFIAHIGPGICGKCYEVSEPIYLEITSNLPNADAGYRKIDIRREVSRQLDALGVKTININKCTLENEGYFSFRRAPKTGRQCGAIVL